MTILRARPALAILLVLLSLALISGVVYAIGRMSGYIPGIGLVDQSVPLRVLAEPVTVERDGITITVQQLVADSGRTLIVYRVNGIPAPEEGFPICGAVPILQLPDGSSARFLGGGGGSLEGNLGKPMSYETRVNYASIPTHVKHVNLVFPCILPEGTGPENWQIPLELSSAPEGLVTPAIELEPTFVVSNPNLELTPTPTFEVMPTLQSFPPSFPATPTPVPNGSGLYLDKVIELPESYILVGNFTDAGDLPGNLETSSSAHDYLPQIRDASGNPVAFEVRADIRPEINWGGVHYWAYEIARPVSGPLQIIVDQVNVIQSSTTRFEIDTGPDPHPGQEWQLDLPVRLSRYDFILDTVGVIEDGYILKFHSDVHVPEGISFLLDIPGSSLQRGPTSAEEDRRSPGIVRYSESITYLASPPTGHLTMELTLFESIPIKGPWTLTWTPPGANP